MAHRGLAVGTGGLLGLSSKIFEPYALTPDAQKEQWKSLEEKGCFFLPLLPLVAETMLEKLSQRRQESTFLERSVSKALPAVVQGVFEQSEIASKVNFQVDYEQGQYGFNIFEVPPRDSHLVHIDKAGVTCILAASGTLIFPRSVVAGLLKTDSVPSGERMPELKDGLDHRFVQQNAALFGAISAPDKRSIVVYSGKELEEILEPTLHMSPPHQGDRAVWAASLSVTAQDKGGRY